MSPHPELFAFPAWYFTGQDGKVHYDDDMKKIPRRMPDDDAQRTLLDFPIGGFSPPEGRLARGFKPPAFSRFLFQSAVKSAESF